MVLEPSQVGFMPVSPHRTSEAVGFHRSPLWKFASSGFIQSSKEGVMDLENMFMSGGKAILEQFICFIFICSEIDRCYVAWKKYFVVSLLEKLWVLNLLSTDPHNFQLPWLEDWYAFGLAQAWIPQDYTWMGGWTSSFGRAEQVPKPLWWSIWVLMYLYFHRSPLSSRRINDS